MPQKTLIITCILSLWLANAAAQVEERTIIDYERKATIPWMEDYSQLGLRTGAIFWPDKPDKNWRWSLVPTEAFKLGSIKGMALQHVHLDESRSNFPIAEFLAYERDEVRQGRDPLFITATYEGKKRPVLMLMFLPGRIVAKYHGAEEVQAVNIRDDRYIKFWVKNHIRRRVTDPGYHLWNWVIGLDNSTYRIGRYVVVDDEGQYHRVIWDEPFPQTGEEWMDAAQWALHRIKALAPDVVLLHNPFGKALEDEARYGEVFGALDGATGEQFSLEGVYSSPFDWRSHARKIPPAGPDAYKIQVFSDGADNLYEMQQLFLAYLILSGPNAFFGPHYRSGKVSREIPPDWYASMKNMLGSPTEHPQIIQEVGEEQGYLMFSRYCEGGIVYLNVSGTTKQITLPDDRPYYDPNGNPVSQVFLNDCMSTYVTIDPMDRVAKPRINPRRPGLVTGPLTITLDPGPFIPTSVSRIFYTLDGTEPDERSPIYSVPFKIHESCVVKAKAFDRGNTEIQYLPSFTNFATYRLTDEEPIVEFHHSSDWGSEFLEHDYPVVSLSHVSAHPVTVEYQVLGGTAQNGVDYVLEPGKLTIRPGEQHRSFYVNIINDDQEEVDENIILSISNPANVLLSANATLGENTIYTYTIQDNDRDPIINEFIEGFETGDFSKFDWESDGDSDWFVTPQESNSGTYSAQPDSIDENESSTLEVELDCVNGEIAFYCKVSSERDCDLLEFYIEGVKQDEWSGEQDWTQVHFPVTAGKRTFRWTYSRDESLSDESDTAWIDDITFPVDD